MTLPTAARTASSSAKANLTSLADRFSELGVVAAASVAAAAFSCGGAGVPSDGRRVSYGGGRSSLLFGGDTFAAGSAGKEFDRLSGGGEKSWNGSQGETERVVCGSDGDGGGGGASDCSFLTVTVSESVVGGTVAVSLIGPAAAAAAIARRFRLSGPSIHLTLLRGL